MERAAFEAGLLECRVRVVGSKWLVAEDDVEEVGLFVVLHAVNSSKHPVNITVSVFEISNATKTNTHFPRKYNHLYS